MRMRSKHSVFFFVFFNIIFIIIITFNNQHLFCSGRIFGIDEKISGGIPKWPPCLPLQAPSFAYFQSLGTLTDELNYLEVKISNSIDKYLCCEGGGNHPVLFMSAEATTFQPPTNKQLERHIICLNTHLKVTTSYVGIHYSSRTCASRN